MNAPLISGIENLNRYNIYELLHDCVFALKQVIEMMYTFQGNLFHIDFGYILGRDPKPLPPPMKLSKEMVSSKFF